MTGAVLGIDPGSVKAGYALVDRAGNVLRAGIEPIASLPERVRKLVDEQPVACLAIGKGTRSRNVAEALAVLGLPAVFVDEFETSRRARDLYFAEHPPRGWRRLIPLGMQLPPRPIDDYAAILIARSYLSSSGASPQKLKLKQK
jgi:RNase H-fold protein (predicted Holliday junction resolvase)